MGEVRETGTGRVGRRSPGIWRGCPQHYRPGVETMLHSGELGLLRLGGGGSSGASGLAVHRLGAQAARLVEALKAAEWNPRHGPMPRPMRFSLSAGGMGPGLSLRGAALRGGGGSPGAWAGRAEYQLFATAGYTYRVFVTNMKHPVDVLVWFYNQRGGSGEPDQRSQS